NASLPLTSWENVRFIHFNLTRADFSHPHFEDAFLAFVPTDAVLIWENETAGILIETDTGESLSKKELLAISSTLESDFYVKTRMFSGRFHSVNQELHFHRKQEKKCFDLAQLYLPDLKVTDLADIIPHSLISDQSATSKTWYINEILGKTIQDTELIKTIKTYIECNSNATYAAKQLYIHRNSLQYRIDKFTEKTGLDIRNFSHALAAYLIILLND
ncbi:PucR family transcriptional regulator, partial [Peribacillus sp. NPDC060186]